VEIVACYIIRGKPELKKALEGTEYADVELIAGPQLWTNSEGGRTVHTKEDYIPAVKRLFVAYVKHVILQPGDGEALFGHFDVEETTFDKWWNLEVFHGFDNSTADVARELEQVGHGDAVSPILRRLE
jgi:hypothetical protein